MKAYKVFNPDWTCNGFQYEVGKTYTHKGSIQLCNSGFHACKKMADCFNYYSFDPKNKVAEVELLGKILGEDGDKQVTDKIKIVKELSWNEMLELANSGHGNSGNWNSGDGNSGDWNSGNWNSRDSNSGNRNSGSRNSGNMNSGNWNSGSRNSGNMNSGNWNSRYKNSGDGNSGGRNSGYRNSGNKNSGNRNSGNRNSGDWNSGNWNSGNFNSKTPNEILIFNKPCKRSDWDDAIKPNFIYFELNIWVDWDDMTDNEKKDNKDAFVTKGYLKQKDYKQAWKEAYDNASKEEIALLKALPNFDADVFEEITGIKV